VLATIMINLHTNLQNKKLFSYQNSNY